MAENQKKQENSSTVIHHVCRASATTTVFLSELNCLESLSVMPCHRCKANWVVIPQHLYIDLTGTFHLNLLSKSSGIRLDRPPTGLNGLQLEKSISL